MKPAERAGRDIVTRPDDLIDLCRELRARGTFAVDMEFESEHTYWPRLHLVQVATPDEAVLIDPEPFRSLDPLLDLIADPAVRKVTHAGRQDAEIAFHLAGRPPRNWFDTQIAAALLGMGEQIGYASLVAKLLGLRLAKTERVTDWSIRPLAPEQVRYALDDVRYLPEIERRLSADLARMERMGWLEEELAFYADPGTYERDPDRAWLRVAGKGALDRRGLGILRELARWRERDAARRNEPRGRVVSDAVLVEIALRRPAAPEELRPLRRLHHRELERSGAELVAAVRRGLGLSEAELPVICRGAPDDPEILLAAHFLDVLVRLRARELQIAPSYLADQHSIRRLVEQLAGRDDSPEPPDLLQGWRRDLIGEDLVTLYRGQTALRMSAETRQPALVDTNHRRAPDAP